MAKSDWMTFESCEIGGAQCRTKNPVPFGTLFAVVHARPKFFEKRLEPVRTARYECFIADVKESIPILLGFMQKSLSREI
jgi:hypothetical protein